MRNLLFPLAFCIFCFLLSCNPKSDETVTVIKHGKNTEYRIHTQKIKDSLHLKLSDFAKDFEFIPLETKEECVISYGVKYYIDSDYFLMEKRLGDIYQFGRDGRFIRKLVKRGPGPTEFRDGGWTVDEENQILYLTDLAKHNYFLQFDLRTGEYLGDLKKAIPCRSSYIEYLEGGLLMVAPYDKYDEDGIQDYVFYQDLKGNKVASIPAPADIPIIWSEISYANYCDQFRIKFASNDTIFSIVNDQLLPYLTFDFGKENPSGQFDFGHIDVEIDKEVESWLTIEVGVANKIPEGGSPSFRMSTLALDKKQGRAYHRGKLYIDPTNDPNGYWITFNNNGLFVKDYPAIKLLKLAEEAFKDPDFKEPYRSKLKAVVKNLSEEDNPVLLVGKYR